MNEIEATEPVARERRDRPDRYRTDGGAAAYRRKYEESWLRRLSNRRELAIIARVLAEVRVEGDVLDCPCGAARLVPTLLEHADRVTAVDRSAPMIEQARDALGAELASGRVDLRVAPADELPFPDDAFDVTVCHRLIYHVQEPPERARIFAELARVTRRFVVLCYNDATTLKVRLRRLRGRSPKRLAWTREDLSRELRESGLMLDRPSRRVNGLSSTLAIVPLRVVP